MSILRRRTRKGPGLNGHAPMPPDATGTAAELHPDLANADLAALELAAVAVPAMGPAARARGTSLAASMRRKADGADDAELLTGLLPVLHWMDWALREGIFPAGSWGVAVNAVLAACWELNGGEER